MISIFAFQSIGKFHQPFFRRRNFFLLVWVASAAVQNAFAQPLRFQDVTHQAGVAVPIDPNGYGHGVAVADFNGDGLSDIYVVAYDTDNSLLINNGDGTFTDRARQAGVISGSRFDRGVAAADFDNDGDVDLYIASGAGTNKLLYVSDGKGSFLERAFEAGLRLPNFQGQGVSWGDYDNDGDLDLFLPSFEDPARMFRQEADHTFTEVTEPAGIIHSDHSVQSVFFDFDLDGDLDIFVSRGEGFANRLFVNQGNGTFLDEAEERRVADPDPHGQGLAVADYDSDGDLDVYMSNSNGPNRLYRNNGMRFEEVADAAGVDDHSRSLGCMFADFNNDGWPDLYVGNFGRNRIYRNNGDGTFTDETDGSGADDPNRAYGTAVLDYDNDGRVDIFFSNSGQPSNLLHNVGASHHWLKIALTGKNSNRNGIGGRAAVTSGGRRQLQQLVAGFSMVSGGDLIFHFGLGASAHAEKIEIFWPSGQRDILSNVPVDRALNILEGSYDIPADTTAPQLADIMVETNSNSIATTSWMTNEPATAQIEYGLTASYGSQTPPSSELGLHHTVRIAGLMGEERYHFRVLSQDSSGNLAVSKNQNFATTPNVFPPIIRFVQVQNLASRSAEITWRTQQKTLSAVEYGTTPSYGLQAPSSSQDLQHHVKLSELNPSTKYYFQITARYGRNQIAHSRGYAFTTLFEPDTTRPVIQNVSARDLTPSSASITWDTDEAATSQVDYGIDASYGQTLNNDALKTHHEIALTSLQVWLWTIVNGEYVGGLDLGRWSGSSDPVAGDAVSVVIREEADANYFDYYINGRYSATAVDYAKHFPRSDNWYAGVFMRGEAVHDECDDFSVTYASGGAGNALMIADKREVQILPLKFALSNYPNPFRAAQGTRFHLQLPEPVELQVTIFDVLGRVVKEIAEGNYAGGVHEWHWRGDNQTGQNVAPGVYILRSRHRRAADPASTQLLQRILILP